MDRVRTRNRSRESSSDSSDDSGVDRNRRRRRLEPFLGAPKQPFFYPDQASTEKNYLFENPAHRLALFILSFLTLLLSCALVASFFFGDDEGSLYHYFAVTGARHIEFKIVAMMTVFFISGIFPAVIAIWASSIYGEVLIVAYLAVGRVATCFFCCTVAAWVFVFVSPISSCKTKLGSSIKTSYGGEVAWDSESVAWNYILLKHKTCALTNVTDLGDWGHKRWVQKSSWELSRWYRGFKSLGSNEEDDEPDVKEGKDFIMNHHYFYTLGYYANRRWPLFCCPNFEPHFTHDDIVNRNVTPSDFSDDVIPRLSQCYPNAKRKDDRIAPLPDGLITTSMATSQTTTSTTSETSRTTGTGTTKLRTTTTLPYDASIFESVTDFNDIDSTVVAKYYMPKGIPKNYSWLEAQEYCKNASTEDTGDLNLAVGFNTNEIVFLTHLEVGDETEYLHLGFSRKYGNKTFTSVVGNLSFDENFNPDNWAKNNPHYKRREDTGCLMLDRPSEACRADCVDARRYFICAKYFPKGSNYTLDAKLEKEKLAVRDYGQIIAYYWFYRYKDYSKKSHTLCKRFDNAAVAIGINRDELEFLQKLFAQLDFHKGEVHLGFFRYHGEYVYHLYEYQDPKAHFAAAWAKFQPHYRDNELYGSLSREYTGRMDSKLERKPFVCAHYLKAPGIESEIEDNGVKMEKIEAGAKRYTEPKKRLSSTELSDESKTAEIVKSKIMVLFGPSIAILLLQLTFIVASITIAPFLLQDD